MHPVMPYILSSSDDMLIKLWDWEKVRLVHVHIYLFFTVARTAAKGLH